METRILIPLIVVVAAIIVVAAILLSRKRKSQQLKQHFGSEYDRTLKMRGDSRVAEAELAQREKRVHSFSIHPLSVEDRENFATEWAAIQRRFVDEPATAVNDADNLVNRVMSARGYPMSDFEQRAADVSVSYPAIVENYRAARDIVARHGKGQSSTEDLRQAMVHFRSLFDELLDTPKIQNTGVTYDRAS